MGFGRAGGGAWFGVKKLLNRHIRQQGKGNGKGRLRRYRGHHLKNKTSGEGANSRCFVFQSHIFQQD